MPRRCRARTSRQYCAMSMRRSCPASPTGSPPTSMPTFRPTPPVLQYWATCCPPGSACRACCGPPVPPAPKSKPGCWTGWRTCWGCRTSTVQRPAAAVLSMTLPPVPSCAPCWRRGNGTPACAPTGRVAAATRWLTARPRPIPPWRKPWASPAWDAPTCGRLKWMSTLPWMQTNWRCRSRPTRPPGCGPYSPAPPWAPPHPTRSTRLRISGGSAPQKACGSTWMPPCPARRSSALNTITCMTVSNTPTVTASIPTNGCSPTSIAPASG